MKINVLRAAVLVFGLTVCAGPSIAQTGGGGSGGSGGGAGSGTGGRGPSAPGSGRSGSEPGRTLGEATEGVSATEGLTTRGASREARDLSAYIHEFSEIILSPESGEYWLSLDERVRELRSGRDLTQPITLDDESRESLSTLAVPDLLDESVENWKPNVGREAVLLELTEHGLELPDLVPQEPFDPTFIPANPAVVGPALVSDILAQDGPAPPVLERLQSQEFAAWSRACGEAARRWKERLDQVGKRALDPSFYRTPEEIDRALKDTREYDELCLRKVDALPERDGLNRHVGILVVPRASFPLHCAATRVSANEIVTARHCIYDREGRLLPLSWFRFYVASAPTVSLRVMEFDGEEYPTHFNFELRQKEDRVSLLVEALAEPPLDPLPVVEVGTYGELLLYSHQTLLAFERALERQRDGDDDPYAFLKDGTWTELLRLDQSPICAVLGRHDVCMGHACQTQGGISGAPLFARHADSGVLGLAALHTRYRKKVPVGHCDLAAFGVAPNGGLALVGGPPDDPSVNLFSYFPEEANE